MNDQNAQRLMTMLVQDFGKSAGSLADPHHRDLQLCWCVQGATVGGLLKAFEVAKLKGWIAVNLNTWMITPSGEEVGRQ